MALFYRNSTNRDSWSFEVLEGDLLENGVDGLRVDVSHVININFLCEDKETKIKM